MKTRVARWVVVTAILLVKSPLDAQQQSAIIRGFVIGPDGTPAVGVRVALLDQLGSPVAGTQTESGGRFRLEDVPPGTYTVFAEAAPQQSDARVITVGAALPVDVVLTLAARVTESVVVQGVGDAPAVATRMTIAGDTLRQVPARHPSRAVSEQLATLPGWAGEDNGLLHVRGVDDGVLYVEDGVPVYDRVDAVFGIAPDPAAVSSMNVLTGYIPPEYGLKSGAVVELQSATTPRTGWAGSIETGIGTEALRLLRAVGARNVGSRAVLGVGVAAERSDRFLDPVHPDNLHNGGGVFSGSAHFSAVASDTDLLKANVTGGRSRFQVPHGEPQEDAGQDQRQHLLQNSQSASWQRFWSDAVVSQVAVHRRHADAELLSSPADSPLSARSEREQSRVGMLGGVTHDRGRHTLKFGLEASRLALQEDFGFAVTNAEQAEAADISEQAAAFTPDHPFRFTDRVSRMQWSAYGQDSIRVTDRLTVGFGMRFDRTNLLVRSSQWSPRVGVAYSLPATATVVRASINRLFQPPQPEHLLLSSSAAARALSPFALEDEADQAGGAELHPERQTAWEIGVDQRLAGLVRVDAAYWSRHVRNYVDPNVFFGTTIIFPNTVDKGSARGLDLRLEMARYRGWSSYASYTLSKVEQVGPLNGGLFLETQTFDIGPGTRFTPDHDQRHVGAAGLAYQSLAGFAASVGMRFGSGTPVEVDEDDVSDLSLRPGAGLVDFERGRVRSRLVLDLMVSQMVHRGLRTDTSVRLGVLNFTNRRYALNFGNPFSGTHFGAPRTVRAELRIALR